MPCRDYDSTPSSLPEDVRKIDELTRMLCQVCRKITPDNLNKEFPNVAKWYAKHKEQDDKYALQEIMSKLSGQDQELLKKFGLKVIT